MNKVMTEQQGEKFTKIYKVYDLVDWIIAIIIIVTPIIFIIIDNWHELTQTWGIADVAALASFETFMYSIANIPAAIILPIFIIYSAYTIFCFILYVKVWSIKEIRYTFTYWFDWALTVGLTLYELLIFYLILFG